MKLVKFEVKNIKCTYLLKVQLAYNHLYIFS